MADRSTLLGLAAILLWSATVALARSLSERVGPLTAGAAVYLAAGLLLSGLAFLRVGSFAQVRRLPPLYLYGCGALFVIYTAALFLALGLSADRRQTLEVGLLNYLWPALTLLFSLPLLGKRAGALLIPGTILALLGVVLVVRPGDSLSWGSFARNARGNPAAYALGLGAAIAWALYSNLARRWGKGGGGSAVMVFALGAGALFLLLRPLFPEEGRWSPAAAAEAAFLSGGTALAYLFWDIAMRRGDLVLVASCSYLTPFFSTVVSCLYLGVLPGLGVWLGCLLIIAGSLVSWRSIAGREAPAGRG